MAMSHMFSDPYIFGFYGLTLVYFLGQPTEFQQFTEYSVLLKMLPILYLLGYVRLGKPKTTTTKSTTKAAATLTRNEISVTEISYKNYFTLGLLLSSVGDYFMASRSTITPGVAAFGVAHIMYIIGLFTRGTKNAKYAWILSPGVILTLIIVVTSKIDSTQLMVLICVYNVLVFFTFVIALCCHETNRTSSTLLGAIGASCFAVSDFVILLDLWVLPIPYPQAFIMVTYYLAQFLMAASVFG